MWWEICFHNVTKKYKVWVLFFSLLISNQLNLRIRQSYLKDLENSCHCLKVMKFEALSNGSGKYLASSINSTFNIFSVFSMFKIYSNGNVGFQWFDRFYSEVSLLSFWKKTGPFSPLFWGSNYTLTTQMICMHTVVGEALG